VARRAERTAVALAQSETVNPQALIYLNRLSDLLFVLARVVNRQSGSPETSAQFR
jgi:cob(I)alamin adenosyltransferase